MDKVEILGVKIDNLSLQEVLEKVGNFLESKNKYFIVTANPEFLVAAKKDKNFKDILNYADIAVADGVGLVYAAKFLGHKLQRITGVDLFGYLCELAEKTDTPVYLVGAESGGLILSNGETQTANGNAEIINRINLAKPKILFVALGQVKQEKWIFKHLDQLSSVKVAVGVGGTFDFVAGTVARAPELMRNLGLEWLYRLIQEPGRAKRIFNATVIFSFSVLKNKVINKIKKTNAAEG